MRPWHFALILVVVVVLVFAEARQMQFLDWDDNINVYANPNLSPVTTESLAEIWTKPYFALYIPVTHTIWAGVASLAQRPPDERGITLDPSRFHLANLLVHVMNVLIVFAILRLLLRHDLGAFFGAGLFALHPVQVEPVCWITGMKDLAGALFALLALWQYLVAAAAEHSASPGSRSRLHMGLALLFFALAMLAKQTAAGLIVIAWGLDCLVIGRSPRESARALLPWVPVAIAGAIIAKVFNGPEPAAVHIWGRPFVAGDALAFYLNKLVWPVGLCTDYGRMPAMVLANWWGYVTWLAPAGLAAVLIVGRRRWPILAAAGLAFGMALLPVLGLVPFPGQDVTDRYMYLAMLGPALALGWCIARFQSKRMTAIAAVLLALLAFGSSVQSLHWRDNKALFMRVLEVNQLSWVAHTTLANELLKDGSPEAAYAFAAGALRVKPEYAEAHDTLGRALLMLGRPEDAITEYRRALSIRPDSAATHHALGGVLASVGKVEEAQAEYEETLRLDPQAWYAHDALGVLMGSQGRHEEAITHFRACARIKPDYPNAQANLGFALMNSGREDEAQRVFDAVRARWPHMNVPPRSP